MFFAVGHSTRTIKAFLELLQAHHVDLLADIRTVPRSRHNPQFNREALERLLPESRIEYVDFKALGGLRRPLPDSINQGWENESFRGYTDYMQTEGFERALQELIRLGGERNVAFMCAEGNPFRCHRSLVADALLAHGQLVAHLASRRTAKPHVLTAFARLHGTRVWYPKPEDPSTDRPDEARTPL